MEQVEYVRVERYPTAGLGSVIGPVHWRLVFQLTGGGAGIHIDKNESCAELVWKLRRLIKTIEEGVDAREKEAKFGVVE